MVPPVPTPEFTSFTTQNDSNLLRRSTFTSKNKSIRVVNFGEREFLSDNLLVRIHLIIEMIWWTGLAP